MKRKRRSKTYSFIGLTGLSLLLLSGIHSTLVGQSIEFTYKTYNLEQHEFNVIQNAAYLDGFFEKLHQLKITGKSKINIVHIGDSHIQGDYLTSITRKNFQHDFGNAGRGLIIPGRVAGTYEPSSIRTSSNIPWIAKRCIHPDHFLPIGVGGVTISTIQPEAYLQIRMNDPIHDYRFNTLTLFYQKDKSSFNFSLRDTLNQELALIDSATKAPANYTRIQFMKLVNQIKIQAIKSEEGQTQATVFGINLENGNEGIVYHAIGVTGAKYVHYNAALYFANQASALQPDVFILSLGTNEAADYPYLDKLFFERIDKLVKSLQECNPQAKFILVTPPDSFRRKTKYNPGIEMIREKIIHYAVENGLAFWDMYKGLGGKDSAAAWRKEGLLRPDGIHFTKEGYEYQGNLLYDAIIKSYNNYVQHR